MSKLLLKCFSLFAVVLVMQGCASTGVTYVGDDSDEDGYSVEEFANDAVTFVDIEIDIEGFGVIEATLDAEAAPVTVANFHGLVEAGFYDGLTFHRIISRFMMQGGDPAGNGSGGSGETIVGEFASNDIDNPLSHTRGALSMARGMHDNDSASSQFFIVHEDSTFLDGDYAVFGFVTSGMDVVDEVIASVTPIDDNGTVEFSEQPVINSIRVVDMR